MILGFVAFEELASSPYQPRAHMHSPAQGSEARAITRQERHVDSHRMALRPVPPPFDVMPWPIAAAVSDRWNEPCEGAFEYLAARYPESLAVLIQRGNLDPADLTFAAEILGRTRDSEMVRSVLLPLLKHDDAAVREGVIYGLTRHLNAAARAALVDISANDPSRAVRLAASEALEEA